MGMAFDRFNKSQQDVRKGRAETYTFVQLVNDVEKEYHRLSVSVSVRHRQTAEGRRPGRF